MILLVFLAGAGAVNGTMQVKSAIWILTWLGGMRFAHRITRWNGFWKKLLTSLYWDGETRRGNLIDIRYSKSLGVHLVLHLYFVFIRRSIPFVSGLYHIHPLHVQWAGVFPHHACGEQHGSVPSGLHSAFEPSESGYRVPQRLSLLHLFEPEKCYQLE